MLQKEEMLGLMMTSVYVWAKELSVKSSWGAFPCPFSKCYGMPVIC